MAYLLRTKAHGELGEVARQFLTQAETIGPGQITRVRPEGFPLLFDRHWKLIETAMDYLHRDVALRGATPKTIRTYAEVLFDWFETLEQNEWDWTQVTDEELAAYRERMLRSPSPKTGRPYEISTINLRVGGVVRFYSWAHSQGFLESPCFVLFAPQLDVGRAGKGHLRTSRIQAYGAHSTVWLRQYERLPHPLMPQQARELLAVLRAPFDLMARWQLYTGLRVSELVSLTLQHVRRARKKDFSRITVTRKGARQGFVLAPYSLLEETRRYIEIARVLNPKYSRVAQQPLFTTITGKPVSIDWYQRQICQAAKELQIRMTSHTLRATFACWTLHRAQKLASSGADINPLLFVKVLMGHSRIDTTDRYLRVLEVYKADLDALLEGGDL